MQIIHTNVLRAIFNTLNSIKTQETLINLKFINTSIEPLLFFVNLYRLRVNV